jgi:gamma-glutamyltranspeptidase/glutathione hydrolase
VLAGCGGSKVPLGEEGHVAGFYGGVVAEEPRAALIGRSVLSAGGTAGDAAVAMSFALTATMPSRASLGGGGVCVVREPKSGQTEALDFLPRAPAQSDAPGGPRIAVPGMARGLFALHARAGRLRWEELVSPAERLARFGADVSGAFARDLSVAGPFLERDAEARAIFAGPNGAPLAAGERLRQLDLAAVLSRIRAEGPIAMGLGPSAQAFVASVRQIGGALTVEDLRDYRPTWQPTIKGEFGPHLAHFAQSTLGGLAAAELWAMLGESGRYDGTRQDERPHLIAEATAHIAAPLPLDQRGRIPKSWVEQAMRGYSGARHAAGARAPGASSEEGQSIGLAAMDREGGAVACVLTAGKLFGARAVVPQTGIVAAAVPDAATMWSLAPVLVANDNTKDAILVMAGAGDASAPVALAQVLLAALEDRAKLADAIAAPRVTYDAAIDATVVESAGDAIAQALGARAHRVGRVNALARVNGMYCLGGVRREVASCGIATDPRGLGLAVGAE